MITHLLVPLDGSQLSEAALPAAAYLARKLGAQVTLLHLIESNAPSQVHGERHLRSVDEAEAYLREVAGRAFPPGVPVDVHVHSTQINNVAHGILEHAAEEDYDLVVMCAHGRGGLKQYVLGGIAQEVVTDGRKPVLLIPVENDTPPRFDVRQIMVALDTNMEHSRSLEPSAALAKACAATLHALTVIPTVGTLPQDEAFLGKLLPLTANALLEQDEDKAAAYVNAQLEPIRREGVTTTVTVRRGDPSTMIVDEAEKIGADVIALGTHGPGGVDAFLGGSVARKVIGRSKLPLLLVPVKSS
jgi:nucleotide-binding universal stress UspA family protein